MMAVRMVEEGRGEREAIANEAVLGDTSNDGSKIGGRREEEGMKWGKAEICTWMKANALKINEEKTQSITFSKNINEAHMTLLGGTQVVKSQETVRILGVTLDTKISLDQQISSISRSVHMYIRKIKTDWNVFIRFCAKNFDPVNGNSAS